MSEVVVKLQKLYPWQRAVLDAPQRHRLLCVSRQGGKTTVCMQAAARDAMAGRSVLWCAPVHKEIIDPFRSLRDTLAPITRHATNNDEIQLLTGGQIRFRSTDDVKNLRGANYFLIVADELAFGKADVYTTVEPMLNRQKGRFLGLSTPNGFNHFHDLWQRVEGDADWYCVKLPYTECPGLTVEMIEKAKQLYPSKAAFRQEYCASFESAAGSRFNSDWLTPEKIFVEDMPKDGISRKMIGVDWCTGKALERGDYHGICYVCLYNGLLYVDCILEKCPIPDILPKIKALDDIYHPEAIACEANGFQSLAVDDFAKAFPLANVIPLENYGIAKEVRIDRLGMRLERGQIKILKNAGGELLRRQLCDFGTKAHDDGPDSLEIAIRAMTLS